MRAFVFPGQGSQLRGMGRGLFDAVHEYREVEPEADRLLGYSLRELCLEDREGRLQNTQFTQPALYTVNALHYYDAQAQGLRAQFLAGHSLGEYNALLAGGAFDFMTGLRLVQERGRLMSNVKNGGMAAIVGLSATRVAEVIEKNELSVLDIANVNSASQVVVSGPADEIQRAQIFFENAGSQLYMPLRVSAAFHSHYMEDASNAYARFLQGFSFNPLSAPVLSNVTGALYPSEPGEDSIRTLLAQQMSRPVQWEKSIRYLRAQGVTEFKELGPGTVLTRLIQQTQR